jgi:DNA repair exonuclease SbcCD ATPase subunit
MVNASEWKSERKRYEAAWAKYQNVAERIDAQYESLDSGTQDQAPAEEDLSELQQAWKELEESRERLGEHMNKFHERQMTQGKTTRG